MPTLNELLHAASRTFAVGIDLLPSPLREEIETAYLLLRVSDYLEDNESMEPGRKAALLERWAEVLEGSGPLEELEREMGVPHEDTPDALVARNVGAVTSAWERMRAPARTIVGRHVADSSRGMARWALRGPDLADEADLDDYMHEVAGRVGWLLTDLFALDVAAVRKRRTEMMERGREFGLGLQTVNVIRGLHDDWRRGWNYVPRAFGERNEALARLVAKAERHLDQARGYIVAIPRRHHGIRLFCLLPYLFAVRTLAISRDNPAVYEREVKLDRAEVMRILRDARTWGWSNGWIERTARRLGISPGPAPLPRSPTRRG